VTIPYYSPAWEPRIPYVLYLQCKREEIWVKDWSKWDKCIRKFSFSITSYKLEVEMYCFLFLCFGCITLRHCQYPDHTAPMLERQANYELKRCGRKRSWANRGSILAFVLEIHENLQCTQCPAFNSNLPSPEYESIELPLSQPAWLLFVRQRDVAHNCYARYPLQYAHHIAHTIRYIVSNFIKAMHFISRIIRGNNRHYC
jgi:hypothetical protein